MNILVTGGCGFIGCNFIRQRLHDPDARLGKIVNLDKLTYAGSMANLSDLSSDARYAFVRGDIADADLVGELLISCQIDGVINFAAETHVDRSIDSPEPFIQTNILGAQRLLHVVRDYWMQLSGKRKTNFRFLHISTDEVYGSLRRDSPPSDETAFFAPNSPYAASKAAADHLVRAYTKTYGLPTLITRCANNYGPWQFPEKLVPLIILNALEGRALPVYGDGNQLRDWLFVEDHCTAVWLIFLRGMTGGVYNISGGHETTNLDVVRYICSVLDATMPRRDGLSYAQQIVFVPDRPGHDRRYALSSAKLQHELGWSPAIPFKTGLTRTVSWYTNRREWCDEITSKRYARDRLGAPGVVS